MAEPDSSTPKQPPPDEATARSALRWLIAVCALVCAAVFAVNVVVNPLGYFPTHRFRPLTWSSRSTKSERMAVAPPAQLIVLGSSRVMQLDPAQLTRASGLRAYNAAVDSAKAEDWLATTRFALLSLQWPLREIVLGVDVEGLHNSAPPDGRLGGAPLLARHLPWSFQPKLLNEVFTSGLSQSQLASSIQSVRLTMRGHPPDATRIGPDGMLYYVKSDQEIAAGTFRPDFAGTAIAYDGRFAGMTHVGVERLAALRALLELARARNVRVRAFISPLHHSVIAHLSAHREFARLRAETERDLRALEREFSATLTVSDYTDVRAFGGDPELFYDGAHVRAENADRLVRALYADAQGHAVQ